MDQTTARDFMVQKLVVLRPEMDVLEAVQRLLKNKISGAPVVDTSGKLLGIFSEKCAMQVLLDAAYEQLPSNQIRLFMDSNPQTIEPGTQLLSIAQVFLLTSHRQLPVIENDRLVGQVSRRDVMRAALDLLKLTPIHEQGPSLLYLSALRERSEAPVFLTASRMPEGCVLEHHQTPTTITARPKTVGKFKLSRPLDISNRVLG